MSEHTDTHPLEIPLAHRGNLIHREPLREVLEDQHHEVDHRRLHNHLDVPRGDSVVDAGAQHERHRESGECCEYRQHERPQCGTHQRPSVASCPPDELERTVDLVIASVASVHHGDGSVMVSASTWR